MNERIFIFFIATAGTFVVSNAQKLVEAGNIRKGKLNLLCERSEDCNIGWNSHSWFCLNGKCEEIKNFPKSDIFCYDGKIILYDEPTCKFDSECPVGGSCYKGHCCSDWFKTTDVPEFTYETSLRCNPNNKKPAVFPFMFCNPKTRKFTYIGKKSFCNTPIFKLNDQECETNRDCGSRHICIKTGFKNACFSNPYKCEEKNYSTVFKYTKILFIFYLLSKMFYCLYFHPEFLNQLLPGMISFQYRNPTNAHRTIFDMILECKGLYFQWDSESELEVFETVESDWEEKEIDD